MVVGGAFNISEMSAGLNESDNYLWNTQSESDHLGEGTFGKVFLGVHKRTGDKVAVKVFKHVNSVSQEIKMLQTLKHEYIIQLLGIEVERNNRNMVMIMELCNGGSLMSFLNEPENACGLLDDEFLLVFEHLAGGLQYLKRHDVIHRDVKPDNIMRHVLDDGRVIYKLADFGTARELPEGQNFYSLHGTEPYLHPEMFRVCFFKEQGKFGGNTDLWSIGVTLYQTATSSLPFQVRDRGVMLRIYNKMRHTSGIISAIQQPNSEVINYKEKLPSSSRLSLGLKQIITPIIAGLFIQDPSSQWSFTQYSQEVLEVMSRRVINVFYVNKLQMLKVYVKTDQSFDDFKYYVCQQSQVSEENQVFVYKQNLIVNCFEDFDRIGSECVFLFDRSSSEVEPTSNTRLIYENLSNFQPRFMSRNDDDIMLAFTACRDLCVCKNLMDYQSTVYEYFCKFAENFYEYCKEEQKELHKIHNILCEKYSSINSRLEILEKLQDLSHSSEQIFVDQFQQAHRKFQEQSSKQFDDLQSAKRETFINKKHDSYLRIVSKELSDMKSMIKKLCSLKYNEKLYGYEKIKIVHCVRTIMEILTDKMEPDFDVFINDTKRWYKEEFFSRVRALSVLKKILNRYRQDLREFEAEIDSKSNENLKSLVKTRENIRNKQEISEMLEKYKRNTLDMKCLVEENLELLQKMSELVLTVDVDISTDL